MPVWTIAGETGKAWDGTAQTLEFRKISGANLTFRSLAVDELALDIEVEDITAYTAPELGQVVQLYRNGLNFFTGHVTANPVNFTATSQSLRIVVSGPWWWMERINYTSTQTDGTGATATRMTGVFGDATSGTNLSTAIIGAINTMRTLGVPISNIVNVAAFFDVPRVTLNQSTCAQVLSELVRLVPDTMVFFDYSFAVPRINVTRRSVATTRTLTIGTDEIESVDVQPIYEMKVERVELPYIERDTQGRTVFNLQSSGTTATARVQVITVSGPELDTFLPNDLFDVSVVSGYNNYESLALDSPSFKAGKDAGMKLGDYNLDGGFYGGRTSPSNFSGTTGFTVAAPQFVDGTGTSVSIAGKALAIADKSPDWLAKALNAQVVTVKGFIAASIELGSSLPKWLTEMGLQQTWNPYYIDVDLSTNERWVGYQLYTSAFEFQLLAFDNAPHVFGSVRARTRTTIQLAASASSVPDFYVGAQIIAGSSMPIRTITAYDHVTKTVTFATITDAQRPAVGSVYNIRFLNVYQPSDYSFISPPANLAANLLAAQNFTPYEGSITLTQEVAGAVRYRGCKVDLIGSLSEHATMGALVSEESLNIATGQTTITLGTPPRLDYRTFVDRIRKTPQDNIVFV